MVKFLKVVNTVDKITDCIPVVSTVKNCGILLYQLIHKVNKTNPVATSWTDDIKIHALSKSDFMTGVASIPIIGNLTCLIYYVRNAIIKFRFPSTGGIKLRVFVDPGMPMGYLGEASRGWSYGTKKHRHEITALYLARNPNRSEEKMVKSLEFAAIGNKLEHFKQIFDSRVWSNDVLRDFLKHNTNEEAATYVLDNDNDSLTNEDAENILERHCSYYKKNSLPIIKLLTEKYPNMDVAVVSKALVSLADQRNSAEAVDFLLENYPEITTDDKNEAFLKARE
jgi:hypothetical protein